MKQRTIDSMGRLRQPFSIGDTGILFLPPTPRLEIPAQRYVSNFSLAGFEYAVLEDPQSLLHQTEEAFGNHRLEHVGQWGLLEWSVPPDDSRDPILTYRCPHRRRWHMRDAYALMTLVTEGMHLPKWEKTVLRIAAETHDGFTVAGGDTMKHCDPQRLHEERVYGERLLQTGWLALAKRFRLPEPRARKLLVDTVQGHGPYRDLMKLVDWMAYLARDAVVYQHMSANLWTSGFAHPETLRFMDEHPRACGLWESIRIKNGQVFLTDLEQYIVMARLRMRLYHEVYLSASMRYKEFLIAGVVGRALYEDGVIDKDLLLRWTDHDLETVLCQALGVRSNYELDQRIGRPHVELYQSTDEAHRREEQLLREGVKLVFTENLLNYRIRPGLDFLGEADDGSLQPFHLLRPDVAEELTRASRLEHPVRLYYASTTDLPPKLIEALDRYHARHRHNETIL